MIESEREGETNDRKSPLLALAIRLVCRQFEPMREAWEMQQSKRMSAYEPGSVFRNPSYLKIN
jgi:hypothetical protein